VSAKCEPTFLSPLQVSNARFKQAEALVQLRQAGEQKCAQKEGRWKALIGAPRVGGTIECGGRASAVALNAAASCAVHLQRVRRRMRRSRMAGTTRTKPSWKCAHELPPCNSSSLCARCLLRSDPICMGGVR
jgi:hypothetical protein